MNHFAFQHGAPATLALLALFSPALAQGGDDCSTPTTISGIGVFSYDNTLATQSGFDGGDSVNCFSPAGTDQLHFDLFYAWTPTVTAPHRLTTCSSGLDTSVNIHLGSDCSATCIVSVDGGLCTNFNDYELVLDVIAGTTYLIQTGTWTDTGADTGPTDLIIGLTPPDNDTCTSPDVLVGEGSFLVINEFATTSEFSGGVTASSGGTNCFGIGGASPIENDLFYIWTAQCGGDYLIDTEGSTASDTKLNVHLGTDCTAVCLEGDDDDGTGFLSQVAITGATAGTAYLVQVGSWSLSSPPGDISLNINRVGLPCPGDITVLCDPADSHYAGDYVKLDTSYLGSGVGSDLHLEATDGPAGEFGFVLVASSGGTGFGVFNGVLCLGSPQGRYNPQVAINQGLPQLNSIGQFDATGVLLNLAGTASSTGGTGFDVPLELPFSPAGQVIQAADTYYFQVWYRDIDANSNPSANFSNMIEVQFP